MKGTAISMAVAAAGISSAAAFTGMPVSLPVPAARSSGSSMSMRLGGGNGRGFGVGRGGGGMGGGVRNFFFGRPGTILGGGGGSMDGAGGGGGGGGNINNYYFGSEEEEEGNGAPLLLAAGAIAGLWDQYNEVLAEKPILTKACTSLCGFSVGDTLAQNFVSKTKSFDYARLVRMAAFGFLFHGTISHFFYNELDRQLPGTAALTVVSKVFIDQVLWAPIFTFVYLSWIGITSGQTPSQIWTKVKNDLIKGVVGSWTVWPLAHTINFKFVPTEQRLLYINTIQIFYNIFLSVLGSGSAPAPVVTGKAGKKGRK